MVTKKKKSEKQEKTEQEELKLILQRVQADFENYKKRVERDREDTINFAAEKLCKKLLPVVDNLELALQHAKVKDDFHKGVELIYASLMEVLVEEGVQPIPALGLPFDPHRHEALMRNSSEKPENTVIEEMQRGFTLHGRVLRPTKVIVSKGGD